MPECDKSFRFELADVFENGFLTVVKAPGVLELFMFSAR